MQTAGQSGLDQFDLLHSSLPELNLSEVSIESSFLDQVIATPFYIAGMSAGIAHAGELNLKFAEIASARGWLLGVGSQRRELDSDFEDHAIAGLATQFPQLKLVSNLGLSQLITLARENKLSQLFKILDRSKASLLAIHLNPLQEAIQGEGTPEFKGGLSALKKLIAESPVPVLVKETGSGMSESTLQKLSELKPFAIDVSGKGGTHWGRIEGKRAASDSITGKLGKTFENWGISTVQSMLNAGTVDLHASELWASGGVRSGVDAAKLIALGAARVGFAKPALEAAMAGVKSLDQWMATMEQELRVAMFCSEAASLGDLTSQLLIPSQSSSFEISPQDSTL
jgi:isopentenyl-diphosphate delta-isomerase